RIVKSGTEPGSPNEPGNGRTVKSGTEPGSPNEPGNERTITTVMPQPGDGGGVRPGPNALLLVLLGLLLGQLVGGGGPTRGSGPPGAAGGSFFARPLAPVALSVEDPAIEAQESLDGAAVGEQERPKPARTANLKRLGNVNSARPEAPLVRPKPLALTPP